MANRLRQGHYEENGFPGLLRELVRELAEGRLEVSREGVTRRLWLEAGQVNAVVSDLEEEKLGAWLVSRRLLEPHRMAIALLKQPEGVRYGTFLVMEKLLALEALTSELAALSIKIVSRLLFDRGEWVFVPGDRLPRDAATHEMTTASLLVAAVRAVDDTSGLLRVVRPGGYLWGAQDVLMQYQQVQLLPQEAYLLSRIDGQTTASGLQRLVPLPGEETIRALAALVVAGLAEIHDGPVGRQEAGTEPAGRRAGTGGIPQPPPGMSQSPQASNPVGAPYDAPASRSPAEPLQEFAFGEAPESSAAQQAEWDAVLVARPAPALAAVAREESLDFSPEQEREHAEVLRLASDCRRMDPYALLGLPPSAKLELVTPRFREVVRRFHPDRANEPHLKQLRRELAEISSAVLEAYDEIRGHSAARRTEGGSVMPQQAPTLTDEARRQMVHEKVNQARRLLRRNDEAQAAELLDQAVRLAPDPETLLFLAKVEFQNPMWVQRGLDRLRHAVSMDPRFTRGWLELANYWGTRGHPERQKQCLEKILAYEPGNADVRAAIDSIITSARPARRPWE